MNTQFYIGILILGLCLSSGIPAVATSTSAYDLNVEASVDTPSRTISFDGETHEVSAVAKARPGETLSVSVSAPNDADYRVNLYNGDRQVAAQRPATGNANVQFDLTDYNPGSYMLLLYKDGDYKDVYPVVVQGYETSIAAPSHISSNMKLNVTVTAEKTSEVKDPSEVNVVLANDDQTVQATATSENPQEYSTSIPLSDFQPGEARIYAVVQGNDDAFKDGRKELLGISDASTVTIAPSTTRTTTETTESSDSPTTTEQTQGVSTTSTTTTTSTNTTTSSANSTASTATPQPTTTSETMRSQSPSTMTSTSTASTSTVSTTISSVITPGQSTTTPEASGQGIPGFGLSGSLVALSCFLILLLRR